MFGSTGLDVHGSVHTTWGEYPHFLAFTTTTAATSSDYNLHTGYRRLERLKRQTKGGEVAGGRV